MPTRYLKPGVRDSEAIDSLSPLAEVLFYRLLVTVDDFGRYDGRAAMVKAHCFPIKDMPVGKCAALLQELHDCGLVMLYTVDDKPYVQMCKWDNAPRAKESKFPPIEAGEQHLHTDARNPRAVLPLTVTVTETETVTENRKPETENCVPRKRGESDYTEDFLRAWGEYPDRPGNTKATAFKAWSARIKDGISPEVMIEGVKRYSAYCQAMRTESRFIKHAATFFGPDRHFESDWTAQVLPASATRQGAVAMPMTFKERDEANARKTYEAITGKPHPDNVREAGEVIDVTPAVTFLEHGQ